MNKNEPRTEFCEFDVVTNAAMFVQERGYVQLGHGHVRQNAAMWAKELLCTPRTRACAPTTRLCAPRTRLCAPERSHVRQGRGHVRQGRSYVRSKTQLCAPEYSHVRSKTRSCSFLDAAMCA